MLSKRITQRGVTTGQDPIKPCENNDGTLQNECAAKDTKDSRQMLVDWIDWVCLRAETPSTFWISFVLILQKVLSFSAQQQVRKLFC